MNDFIGHITIIKKTKDGEFPIYEARNTISDGLAYSMINMFTSVGSKDTEDYAIKYFQLGTGSLSGYLPAKSINRNFYTLATPLTESQYGYSSTQGPIVLDQAVAPNGNFTSFTDLSSVSAVFIPLRRGVKTAFHRTGVSVRINIDENLANGVSIQEIGIFLKNPTGAPNNDKPILMAYKTFPVVNKNSDFSLIIDWKIQLRDQSLVNFTSELGGGGSPLTTYSIVTVDMVSGAGNSSNAGTGDNFSDRFELLIPSGVGGARAPMMVIFNDFGDQVDSYVRFSALAEQLNERGWYGLIPLGRSTTDINDNTAASLYPHSKATLYNMNSWTALEHTKDVVNYIRDHYLINDDRIYFYGFGMGGGCALSIAAKLTDDSQGVFRPAAVISHNGLLSNRFTWWYNADSTLTSPSGDYPTPPNATMLPMAKAMSYWCATASDVSGPVGFLPSGMTDAGADGIYWSSISAVTPTNRAYRFLETTPIDFNLNTSADLWVSTCNVFNLTHVPTYLHWVTNNPSGPPYYLPNNILSGFVTTGTYANSFDFLLRASATGTHDPSSIDLVEALDFCASNTKQTILTASTVITREGYYWGMFVNSYLEPDFDAGPWRMYTNNAATQSVGLSGLAFWIWEKVPSNNELTIFADWAIYNDNNQNVNISVSDLGFGVIDASHPLVIKTSSGLDLAGSAGGFLYWNQLNYPHPWLESGNPPYSIRRLTLSSFIPLSITYYEEVSPNVYGSAQVLTRTAAGNWRSNNITRASEDIPNGNLILIRRGKYEIVPYP